MNAVKMTLATALALGAAAASARASVTAFEEHFNYANTTALDASWTLVTGQGGYLALGTNSSVDPNQPYAQLNNGISSHALSATVSQDWTISFNVSNPDMRRGTWIGLFDSAGEHGYAVLWDSGLGPNGTLSMRKFDLAAPFADWSANGTILGSGVDSGHAISSSAMARMTLSWSQADGKLTVTVDDTPKITVNDTSFSSFTTLFLKGNGNQAYDDIIVTTTAVPEPAGVGLLGLAGLILARRR